MARKPAVLEAAPPPRRTFTAAARRIDLTRSTVDGYRHRARAHNWQKDLWDYFDLLGLIKQPTYFLANMVSLCRIFIADEPDDDQAPVASEPSSPGFKEADDVLQRLKAVEGGHPGFLRETTVNLKIAGEFYLRVVPARPMVPPGPGLPNGRPEEPERWEVRSVSEIDMEGETYRYRDSIDDTPKPIADDEMLVRCWMRHPRFSNEADCTLRGALLESEELLILSRAIKAVARSRIAGAGIIKVPNGLRVTVPVDDEEDAEPQEVDFAKWLQDVMVLAIQEEGDASAVVPVTVRGEVDDLNALDHMKLDRQLEPEFREIRKELRTTLLEIMDAPLENTTGLGKQSNHWGATKVDQQTWDRFGRPVMLALCELLTTAVVRPIMLEAGVLPEVAAKKRVWFDPAEAIADPDPSATAMDAHKAFIISNEAARRELGYSDEDAPDDAEIIARIRIEQAIRLRPTERIEGAPGNEPIIGIEPSTKDTVEGTSPPVAPVAVKASTNGHGVRAAMPDPIGARLARIDRDLRTRIEEAASATMRRALERAGAKVVNRARRQKDQSVVAAVENLPKAEVCSHVGAAVVAALALTDEDLLGEDVDGFEATFDARVRQAQARVRAMLAANLEIDDEEMAEIEAAQDNERHAAWLWLGAALVTLARERLFTALTPEEPAVSTTVPPGLVREAVARAGGEVERIGPGEPLGGVGIGQLVLDVFARHGQVVSGWRWIHDEPDRPFPAHEDLDGVEFDAWDDDILTVSDQDSWLGVGYYQPGDHAGCSCSFEAIGLGKEQIAEPVAAGALVRNPSYSPAFDRQLARIAEALANKAPPVTHVTVQSPDVRIEPAQVTIEAPPPAQVTVAAPPPAEVHVDSPITVNNPSARSRRLERDADGNITAIVEVDDPNQEG